MGECTALILPTFRARFYCVGWISAAHPLRSNRKIISGQFLELVSLGLAPSILGAFHAGFQPVTHQLDFLLDEFFIAKGLGQGGDALAAGE